MKSTKKALLLSMMSMLLCVAMLMGTTFAWFTDSVTSGANTITAGNLDVELWHTSKNVTTEQEITNGSANLLFKDVERWEPGAYAYETFTVKNVGSLALKYKMNLNVVGKNDLNGHDLTEVIKVAVTTGTAPANREAAAALDGYTTLENWMLNKDNLPLDAKDGDHDSDTFTVVLYWQPTDNDNWYNANNNQATSDHAALYLNLGVSLYATQYESESDSFGTDYDKAAALPVNSVAKGNLIVTDASTKTNAVVNTEQTITDADEVMSVTYPNGVKLANNGDVTGTDEKKTPVQQKLEYKGATPSSASVTIDDDKAVAQYELTLPVANDNEELVTVTINYTKNLSGVKVYHSGNLLPANGDGESATYDAVSGVLTLHLKHASPIDIVYNRVSNLPANAKLVMNLEELEAAVGNLKNGDYIAFGANIVQDKVNTTSGQITFKRAVDEDTPIEATLDLNGYVFDGQIGGWNLGQTYADKITVNVIGTEKAVAQYYEHETGHHMVKAHAVNNYYGKTVIKSGLFESNNTAVSGSGGEVIINGGTIRGSADNTPGYPVPAGGCVHADGCNMVINGGTFEAAQYGSVIGASNADNKETVVTINGGTFSGYCMFDMGPMHSNKTTVVVNGGTFTVKSPDGSDLKDTQFAYENYDYDGNGDVLVNNDNFVLSIKGGTFNMDPSDYVADGYHAVPNDSTWTVVAD